LNLVVVGVVVVVVAVVVVSGTSVTVPTEGETVSRSSCFRRSRHSPL